MADDRRVTQARPPTIWEVVLDRSFRASAWVISVFVVVLVFLIVYVIGEDALPAVSKAGGGLLLDSEWDPGNNRFGLLPAIVGTVTSSILALLIGGFFGVAIAIVLTQDFLPAWLTVIFKNIVELLAAIPSVVYGLWGIAVIIPLLSPMAEWLFLNFEWVPLFSQPLGATGGLAPAALVLAIMILPTIAAVSRDALASVHPRVKEAAYGLGATRWEVIFGVMLPTASGGIFGALVLGLGRAIGETMALAMLMGNKEELSWSLFAPGNTLAALLANNYKEAGQGTDLLQHLMYAALVLLLITLVVNVCGTLILQQVTKSFQGQK